MKKYLLPENGNFYKANLHCHTTCSDGRKTPEEIKKLYQSRGYSIVAYTDHHMFIPHNNLSDENFLSLSGIEIDVYKTLEPPTQYMKTCHINMIAINPDNTVQPFWREEWEGRKHVKERISEVNFDDTTETIQGLMSEVPYIMEAGTQKGFFMAHNHPTWSLEDYSDYMTYNGMHALEIFNGGCIASGYDEYNMRVYDDILRSGRKIYCIGGDDNHNRTDEKLRSCDSFWAFTMIKSPNLDYRSVTSALLSGHFYASEGPEIFELWYEDGKVHVECSDADRINCTFKKRHAETLISEGESTVTCADFDIPQDCGYFRITVIDKSGKRACTNAYFAGEDF